MGFFESTPASGESKPDGSLTSSACVGWPGRAPTRRALVRSEAPVGQERISHDTTRVLLPCLLSHHPADVQTCSSHCRDACRGFPLVSPGHTFRKFGRSPKAGTLWSDNHALTRADYVLIFTACRPSPIWSPRGRHGW